MAVRIVVALVGIAGLLAIPAPVPACTGVMIAAGGTVMAANNLDTAPPPRIWLIPGDGDRRGRLCFGTDPDFEIAEGGVNDRGLFISVHALDGDTGWAPDPARPDWEEWEGWYGTGVPDGILARCSTVADAVSVFRRYNLLTLQRVKFLLADASGASAVIEWGAGEVAVIGRGDAAFQISTNVRTAELVSGAASCERYRTASALVAGRGGPPSVDLLRRVLSATHLEFYTPTIYSGVYDLRTGDVRLYYFHNFEESVAFNLRDELAKGRQALPLAELFEVRPWVASVYGGRGGS